MRLLCALGCMLASCLVLASEAIVLLRHDRAGPNLPLQDFVHSDWVLWPSEYPPGTENGLLSILSGHDWVGQEQDLEFKSVGPHRWISLSYRSLANRGYLSEVERRLAGERLTLIENPRGAVGREELLLGLTARSATVSAVPFGRLTRVVGLLVYEALSWDDAAQLARHVSGRTLVIEYPPDSGTRWTRFWRFGRGWPPTDLVPTDRELGVPGLIPLREALDLLHDADRFQWVRDSSLTWGGPNRWLVHGSTDSPVVRVVLFCVAVIATVGGFLYVGIERRSVLVRVLCQGVLIFPAADCLAGSMAMGLGQSNWTLLLIFTELGLLGAGHLIALVFQARWPAVNGLIGLCLVGAAIMTASQPVWSDFSNVFARSPTGVPVEMVGAWVGYLAGTLAFTRRLGPRWAWFGRLATIALIVWTSISAPWWVDRTASYAILPVVPFAAAEGFIHRPFLAFAALLPTSLYGLRHGIVWTPGHLIRTARDLDAFNGFEWLRFLISPLFIGAFAVALLAIVETTGFAAHKVRLMLRSNEPLAAPLWSALALFALGLLNPEMLFASLFLAIGSLVAIVHEALD